MRSISTLLIAAGFAVLAGSAACADDRQEIRDLFAKLRLAIIGADPKAMSAIATPDFTAKGSDGKSRTVKQIVQQMSVPEDAVRDARIDLLIDKFQITPPTATVHATYYYSCTVLDTPEKPGANGKKHGLSTTGKIRTNLVKTPAGWKFKSIEHLTGSARVHRKTAGGARRGP